MILNNFDTEVTSWGNGLTQVQRWVGRASLAHASIFLVGRASLAMRSIFLSLGFTYFCV